MLIILFYTFVGIVAIQLFYYGFLYSKFSFAKPNSPSKKNIGVSVIICAKNESENLKRLIPLLLNQDYKLFEIVLINDASSDSSLDIMQAYEDEHEQIKVVNVKPNQTFLSSKKYALTLGIKSAKFDFLLFTDADCIPISNQWIAEMSRQFTNTKTIVLGYGSYKKIKKSFINLLVRFETLFTAIQYFSYAQTGLPYMAVGRNLAYRKDEFFKVNGFTKHMNIISGDDDLFINQVATAKNTAICFSKNSFTESIPKSTLKAWFKQKRRHISTAQFYKAQHKVLLTVFYISHFLFWLLMLLLLYFKVNWPIVLSLVLIRSALAYIVLFFAAKRLNEKDLIPFAPFLELFLVLSQMVIFISGLTHKSRHWN